MSGTHIRYSPTPCTVLTCATVPRHVRYSHTIQSYAVSGTHIRYSPTPCQVLTYASVLRRVRYSARTVGMRIRYSLVVRRVRYLHTLQSDVVSGTTVGMRIRYSVMPGAHRSFNVKYSSLQSYAVFSTHIVCSPTPSLVLK
eukprot:3024456-Rhodomonas_salina.1